MSLVSLIAAVDEAYGLGYRNRLLCHLPADLAHFKKITLGKPIIMGRKTFESIGRPLPGRWNLVLTRQALPCEGVTMVPSLDQALQLTQDHEETLIIGGAELFNQALPLAQRIYLTTIHHHFPADVWSPKPEPQAWIQREANHRPRDFNNAYDLTFQLFEKIAAK